MLSREIVKAAQVGGEAAATAQAKSCREVLDGGGRGASGAGGTKIEHNYCFFRLKRRKRVENSGKAGKGRASPEFGFMK